jgi:hypothetical protein
MEIEKLHISDKKFDINLKFYFLLKHIVKNKFTEREVDYLINSIESALTKDNKLDIIDDFYDNRLRSQSKKENFVVLISVIKTELDFEIFVFSL